MNTMRAAAAIVVSVSLLFSCATDKANRLRVTSPLPAGTIDNNAVIRLTFSSGVVSPESTNIWTMTPYLQFNPPVSGRFVWQDTATLVFSPDNPLPGDTRFKAELNTTLLKSLSRTESFEGEDGFTFATESFRLHTAEFFYDRLSDMRTVGIKANLEFTYAANPSEVSKHIKLTIDNEERAITNVATQRNDKVIAVEIGTLPASERPRQISVSFDDEFISPETNTRIRMEKPFVFTLAGLEELKIYSHEFGFDGQTSWIKIKTSQEIDTSSIRRFVQLDPVRAFGVEDIPQGFMLRGKFEPGTAFRLLIKKGLESVLGGKLQVDYDADIVVGNIQPSFRFASSSGVYMMLGGQKQLEIKTINLSKLNVRVSQIFYNNLVFFLEGGRNYDYYYDDYGYDEEGYYSSKYRYYVGNYGRQLTYDTIAISSIQNREVTTLFDMSRFLNTGFKSFYLVEIANPAEAWRSTSKLVSVSDLGLIVKKSEDEVNVFAISLATTEPVSGVTVTLISRNNQVMNSAKTPTDGVVRFKQFHDMQKDFKLKLVTAESEGDYNFINLGDYRVETSRFDVGGKTQAESGYDTFLYGDRNIYRPGEKIYVSGIVRNITEPMPKQLPVRLKIFNPKGALVNETQHRLNDEGSFATSYQTLPTSLTGTYRMDLFTGTNAFLATYQVSVEDFVPDRLKINLAVSAESVKPGEKIRYDFQALNFFGPPAAGRNWEFEGTFIPTPFVSKRFPGYRFSDDAASEYSANPVVFTGRTDNEGKATATLDIPKNIMSSGLVRTRGRIAVFDESGRPVYQIAQTLVSPKNYYIGIQNLAGYYLTPYQPQKMRLVAVDAMDNPISGFKAKIELVRREWHSVLRQHGNTLRYVSEQREIPVKTEIVTFPENELEYTYSVPRSGEYVVRVSKADDTGFNRFSFYAYDWRTADITSFEINPEARVEMVFDKPVYTPGEKVKILFRTPFSGKMVVTIERDKMFSYRYLDVANNAASMELVADEKFLPNAYVTAVLFRKIKEQNIPLMVGHGFVPLMVEKTSNKLSVAIEAPEKIRPKTKQKVVVTAGSERNIFVTLAAVDEGICQIKNYKTPDPYSHFYAKKALETETFDFFKHLLPEPEKSSSGGGEAEAMSLRVSPIGVQRFKPVALWSGILKTDAEGKAEVAFDIPEFSGELRLMALAYKGDRFGSAQRSMKVADPVIITPALPRFLAPNDSMTMQITAFNTTDKKTSLKFEIETSGGVVPLARTVTLEIGPNEERFVNAALRTTNDIGKAVVKVRTTAFGEALESVTEIPVRPTAPYATDAVTGILEGGQSFTQEVKDVYLPYGRRSFVTLSPFPVANFSKELKFLVGYPHGCLEQTVSRAFPQIYLRDIAILLDPSILNRGSPTYFVNEAITKLTSMQMPDGSFEYWPGGGKANDWSTVYATHFLLEAKKAGYAVPENMLQSVLNSVRQIAHSKKTQDYYYYGPGNKTSIKRIADKSVIYALYVLSVANSPEKNLLNYYRAEKSLMTWDTQFLLAGGFALSGDRKAFQELLPSQFVTEEAVRTSGYNFDSPIRANALILNVLLETDLNNMNIARFMEYLSKQYRSHYWYSTQDDAFTLLAFGKAARMATATKVEGNVKVNGKEYAYKGGNQKIDIQPFGKNVTITLKGTGRVYYSIVVEGIRTDGAVKIEDKNFRVRREFFNRFGSPVGLDGVKQNDLIIIKLTTETDIDRLENVAITDLLPAGFEIENPRLTENSNYEFVRGASTPEYIDIRDDRINFYTSFYESRRQVFFYMVRAVTQGAFRYAPVVAEAMYDANYYSASGQALVRVTR